jgi:hypothetical protein
VGTGSIALVAGAGASSVSETVVDFFVCVFIWTVPSWFWVSWFVVTDFFE